MQAPLRSFKGDLSLEDAEQEIFSDESFLIELSKISTLRKIKLEDSKLQCLAYLKEIAAKASKNKFFWAISKAIVRKRMVGSFNNVFYNKENILPLKELAKENIVIIAPNHRSVFDFMLIPYFLVNEIGMMPTVLAADVFNKFPVGYIFRKLGTYFVRRNAEDEIYSLVFKHYVVLAVKYELMQLFFIEGGRVKSGGYAEPKIGILKYVLNGIKKYKISKDVVFVPVNISYDFVPESDVVVEEHLSGKRKSIFKSLSSYLTKKNLGNCYINFGKPISLKESLGKFNNENEAMIALGNNLIDTIKSLVVVSPISLLCFTLISFNSNKINYDEFLNNFKLNFEELKKSSCNVNNVDLDKVKDYVNFAVGKKLIRLDSNYIFIDEMVKPVVEYHGRNVEHLF